MNGTSWNWKVSIKKKGNHHSDKVAAYKMGKDFFPNSTSEGRLIFKRENMFNSLVPWFLGQSCHLGGNDNNFLPTPASIPFIFARDALIKKCSFTNAESTLVIFSHTGVEDLIWCFHASHTSLISEYLWAYIGVYSSHTILISKYQLT